MRLTPGITIGAADTVTRQSLYDIWNLAIVGSIGATDLSSEMRQFVVSGSAPSTAPGALWFDTTENLAKYYCDVFEGTGVSCWLAFGPDRFDVPAYATQSIPYGAAVRFVNRDKMVGLVPGPGTTPAVIAQTVGFNELGQTAPSGTWFPMSILGLCTMWYGRLASETPGTFAAQTGRDLGIASDDSGTDGMIRVYAGDTKREVYIGQNVYPPAVQVNGTFKGLFLGPSRQKIV